MLQHLRIRRHHRLACAAASAVLSLTLFVPSALAQSTFGTILGTVRDNSGAVVPNASVKVIDTDENTTRTVTANGNGDYEFVNTKPSHYKLEVTASGFQPFTATGMLLVARQTFAHRRQPSGRPGLDASGGASNRRRDHDRHLDCTVQSRR